MSDDFKLDQKPGSLATVPGFKAGVVSCRLADSGNDLGVLYSESEKASGSAALSRNAVAAASTRVSSPRAAAGGIRAIIVNAGSANCCTGEDGYRAAREIVAAVSSELELTQDRVVIASTGPIGRELDLDAALGGVKKACDQAKDNGKGDLASVLTPTGMDQCITSGTGTIDGVEFHVAGAATPASLTAEDAPSRIVVIATDVAIKPSCLREITQSVAAETLSKWAIDAGAGTNDMLCVLASGEAGNEPLEVPIGAEPFRKALASIAREVVIERAFAGDRSMRLIEVAISGASSDEDANAIARAVAASVPVRIAMHLAAPRWGLILGAAGKARARVVESRATLRISGETVFDRGTGIQKTTESLAEKLREPRVKIELDLGIGESSATLFTSALSDGEKRSVQRYEDRLEAEAVRRKSLEKRIDELEETAKEVKMLRTKVEMSEKSIAEAEKIQKEREELEEQLAAAEKVKKAAVKEAKSLSVQLEIAEGKIKKLHGGG
jgi:glutamate N-acetyltransferase/amino-acid N-acetyltransferase